LRLRGPRASAPRGTSSISRSWWCVLLPTAARTRAGTAPGHCRAGVRSRSITWRNPDRSPIAPLLHEAFVDRDIALFGNFRNIDVGFSGERKNDLSTFRKSIGFRCSHPPTGPNDKSSLGGEQSCAEIRGELEVVGIARRRTNRKKNNSVLVHQPLEVLV